MRWKRMRSWKEAAQRGMDLGSRGTFHAGGVDNVDLLKEGILEPEEWIGLSALRPATPFQQVRGRLEISALATLSEIAEQPEIRKDFGALAEAASMTATPNIRNMATLGGNLLQRPRCAYYRSALFPQCRRKGGQECPAQSGDHEVLGVFENTFCAAVLPSTVAVALSALEGRIRVVTAGGDTRFLSLEELYRSGLEPEKPHTRLEAGELIEAVELERTRIGNSGYLKIKPRKSFDWPLVECAISIHQDESGRIERARVVLGGVAMLPWRALLVEEALSGTTPTVESLKAASRLASHGATPLRDNGYKTTLMERTVEILLKRIILNEEKNGKE